jgi:hypothetical protein
MDDNELPIDTGAYIMIYALVEYAYCIYVYVCKEGGRKDKGGKSIEHDMSDVVGYNGMG